MDKNQIKIRKIKLKNLEEFSQEALSDPAFQMVAPISIIRAASQTKNPHSGPDDISLLAALWDNRCIGYHGLLPGILKIDENETKIYWGSTVYLDTGFRGQGHGKRLIREIQNTAVDLVLTDISTSVEGIYRRMGFKTLGDLPYFQLRLDEFGFWPAHRQYQRDGKDQPGVVGLNLNRLGNWVYRQTKKWVYSVVFHKLETHRYEFKSKAVNQLDEHLKPLMTQQSPIATFHRDFDTVNWMLQHPWIVSKKAAKEDVQNYYFSSVRDLFKFVALEIFSPDRKTRKGFLILSLSRKKNKFVVKILDHHFYDSQDAFIAAYCGIKYAKDLLADRIEYPESLNGFFSQLPFLNRVIKRKKRLYLFYPKSNDSPLAVSGDKIKLDYCDGDTAFT